jgi:hypothetical protein
MRHKLILVTALLLGSCVPGEAQTLAAHALIVPAGAEPTKLVGWTPPTYFPPNFSRTVSLPSKPAPRLTALVIPAYLPDRRSDGGSEAGLQEGSLIEHVRTPFLAESRLAVAQFWKGRLQIEGFDSTRHMQNAQLDPPGYVTLPPSHDQAGLANSGGSDGIRLVFSFGRHPQSIGQPEAWRCVERVTGDDSSCPL